MSKELVGFHWYLVNAQNYKCVLSWWCKKEHKFPNIVNYISAIDYWHLGNPNQNNSYFLDICHKIPRENKLCKNNENWSIM